MTVGVQHFRGSRAGKTSSSFRVIITVMLLLTMSPLIGCMPPSTPFTVASPTGEPTVTPTEPVNATPAVVPSATETPVPSASPTSTSAPRETSITFLAEADASVDESNPTENTGPSNTLRSDGEGNNVESFVRFTVSSIDGAVQSARLRLYATNATRDGPILYLADPAWEESEITWNTRPTRLGGALDNKDQINAEDWVEYDVTSQVTEDGTYSFVLVGDSGDGVDFSSREGAFPPELHITTGEAMTATPAPALPVDAQILVGAGDISICSNDNDELTAELLDTIPGTVFTTGDNAYGSGTYAQYMECYDATWGRHKDRTRPVPGNHEYRDGNAEGYFRYFDNIPPYYAYDLGSWRIYALNSQIDVSEDSLQVEWLRQDLATNPRQCVLAYWHEPRWSSGATHDSDRSFQTLWEVLYDAGAELVLHGHQHSYERLAPMNAEGEPDPSGLRTFIVGTGGRSLYNFGTPLPASEVRDNTSYGVLKLTLYDTGYDWEFVPAAGSTFSDSGSAECH